MYNKETTVAKTFHTRQMRVPRKHEPSIIHSAHQLFLGLDLFSR
uniref:Uncharacterized protein n=1 Tax=Rhizophora mucronata TaxID=61149 RepID=A0A2P2K3T3_RHIMU